LFSLSRLRCDNYDLAYKMIAKPSFCGAERTIGESWVYRR